MSTGDRADDVLWAPPADVRESTVMGRFVTWLSAERGLEFRDYAELHAWSVTSLEEFWGAFAEFAPVLFHTQPREVLSRPATMPGARWFPGATLNFAEHCLQGPGAEVVLIAHSELRERAELTRDELRAAVSAARAGLQRLGVGRGDRVAAYLPTGPEAIAALLAAASLGAVWTSCAPEFGTRSVIDRLSQVEPKVLLTVDGYRYRGRDFDRRAEVTEIRAALPSLAATVWLPYLHPDVDGPADTVSWRELTADEGELAFDAVPVDHPLYILYSSGTTGRPKPIVHGHGAIVLEHLKWLWLHDDIGPGDRYFWFSSTGWMAWNLGVSSLMCGASLVTLDGDPMHPSLEAYWQRLADERVTFLGISPAFILACRKRGVVPAQVADLSALRTITSGGAPLPADGFRWVYESVNDRLYLSSGSGGTDIASSFVGGCRLLPVRPGEIACRLLGVDVVAYDAAGQPVVGQQGELVVTSPMPSMPVGFWGDDDGAKLHATYFDRYPGVWCHGDWVTFWPEGSCIISGRSDATLNRGGVRIGTSEFYRVVEDLDVVEDSLVVHLEDDEGGFGELILFVVLAAGVELEASIEDLIRSTLRRDSSPRHVPDLIRQVAVVPRTISAKKMEIPVKRLLQGADPQVVASESALAVPGSLQPYLDIAAERRERGSLLSGQS